MFQFIRNQMPAQRRRRALTERLRRFTEASGTSPKTPPSLAESSVGTPASFEEVNRSGVWGFTYAGWGAR